ncbi:unnamed protein product [Sphacelaria rigidula]
MTSDMRFNHALMVECGGESGLSSQQGTVAMGRTWFGGTSTWRGRKM